ncbi:MAG: hypothetical protein RLZZ609_135 [Cyanobacteriota bacterium]
MEVNPWEPGEIRNVKSLFGGGFATDCRSQMGQCSAMNSSTPGFSSEPTPPAISAPALPLRYVEVQAALAAVTQESQQRRHLSAEELEMINIRKEWLTQALTDEAVH